MPFFQPSNLTWGQAKSRVARTAGSHGDPNQLIVAGYALEEAIRHWEAAKDWKYLLTVAADINITPGDSTYDLPTDFKKIYNVRMIGGNPRVLYFIDKRAYDNVRPNQAGQSTPTGYVLHESLASTVPGQIELVPTNGISDTIRIYYYRRHVIPDEIAQGDTAADPDSLDFPARFQNYLLAWARALYLADKGGENERLSFWLNLAMEGLGRAKGEDEFHPDQVPAFQPNTLIVASPYNPNDVRPWIADY